MLDICAEFGRDWDICFNPMKSRLMTLGGHNPYDYHCHLFLDSKPLQWATHVKYLCVPILAGSIIIGRIARSTSCRY